LVSDEIYALSTYSHPGEYPGRYCRGIRFVLTVLDFPDAQPFTSMLSLDVEKELGIAFDRARMHG
jgi:1-aminocyclopropane-1-carboxylate synthase